MARPRTRRPERAEQYKTPAYRDLQARLAAAVRRLREEKGWTQEEAAHRCGMTTRLFQRVEGEDVNLTFTSLARLCEGLEVDVVQLFKPRT
jgi:transcriptional regulator with XRE-family HTH domain